MAKITKAAYHASQQFGGTVPYGNLTSLPYRLETDATGKVIQSNATGPLAAGDVVDLGPMQDNWRLEDAVLLVTTALTSGVTASLGFAYDDGIDDARFPQDDKYFMTGVSLSTVGRVRATGSKLVILPKPARLILTLAGAANAKAGEVNVLVYGEIVGVN